MRIKKFVFFLSVFSLAVEMPLFNVGSFGFKFWMLAALAAGILLIIDFYKKGFSWLKQSKMFWLGMCLIFFSLISLINSPLKSFSTKQLLVLIVLAALGTFFEKNIKKYSSLAFWGIALGLFLNSLYAIYQNIAFNNGWPNFEVMAARPNGFFPEPDWLGFYLALGIIPFLVWTGKDLSKSNLPKELKNKFVFYPFLIVILTALIITVARASWLAVIAEMGIITVIVALKFIGHWTLGTKKYNFPALSSRFFKLAGIFILLIFIPLLLISLFHLSRFDIPDRFRSIFFKEHVITVAVNPNTGEKLKIDLEAIDYYQKQGYQIQEDYVGDENVASREEKFTGAWDTIKSHPLLGSGLGITLINTNYEHNANNLFLEWWASAGIGALLTIISLIVYLLLKGLSFLKNNPEKAALILAGTIGFVILNTFNASIFLAFAWFYLAWLLNNLKSRKKS